MPVRDVGQAIAAPENERLAAFANGHPAVLLAISRVPGANVIATVERIRAAVADFQRALILTVDPDVLVILVFRRSVRMTLIPALSGPLRLVAAA